MTPEQAQVFVGDRTIPAGPLKLEDFPPVTGKVHLLDADGVPKEEHAELTSGDLVMIEYPKLLTFYEVQSGGTAEYRTSVAKPNSNCPERTTQ